MQNPHSHTNYCQRPSVINRNEYSLRVLFVIMAFVCWSMTDSKANTPPVIKIWAPEDGASFKVGQSINFSGTAFDLEDGPLPDNTMIWMSDLDNYLGKGRAFDHKKLSPGPHIITLTSRDSLNSQGSDGVFILIKAPEKPFLPENTRSEESETTVAPRSSTTYRLSGVCYDPVRDGQYSIVARTVLIGNRAIDIRLASRVATAVRTYSVTDSFGFVPLLCKQANIDCYLGAWLGRSKAENEKELNSLLTISGRKTNSVKALIVGNEVLLRGDMDEDRLISIIKRIRKSTDLPVTTGQLWSLWLKYAELAREVDFLLIHVQPYWAGISIDKATEYIDQVCRYTQAVFPGKRIVLGEIGWPSTGKTIEQAVPSEKNQEKFISALKRLSVEYGIEYFYYELYDGRKSIEPQATATTSWGIYDSDGSLKPHLIHMLSHDLFVEPSD